jgi:LPS-assembly lipoprotein
MSPTLGRRRLLLALPLGAGLIGLGGCGFRPLYGGARGEAVAEELASVEVRAPLSRLGRTLQNQLIEDLNPAGLSVAKRYRLDVTGSGRAAGPWRFSSTTASPATI